MGEHMKVPMTDARRPPKISETNPTMRHTSTAFPKHREVLQCRAASPSPVM